MSELQRRKVDWSSLPQELLEKIAYCTESRIELLRFRAVCKKWRSSYSSPVSTHLLYPTLPKPIPILSSSIFMHSDRPIYLIGSALYLIQPQESDPISSSKSWVVSIQELNRRRLQVRFPLTKTSIKDLPNNFPRTLNIWDFKASHIGEGLKLCFSNGNEDVFGFEGFQPCCNYPTKSKVVMFHDDDSPTFDTWSVMVLLLNQGGSLGTLKLNGEWKYIDLGPGIHFDDVISLRRDGQLCGIDREGRAYLIDGSECRVIRTMSEPLCKIHTHCYARVGRKFLALIYDLVFMIVRRESKFEVFLLKEEEHCWIEMSDMGNWILFLTFDNVFVVKAKGIPGCKGNCIVFPKNLFSLHSREFCEDYKLFEGASKYTEVGVYYLGEDHCRLVTSEPGFSELFWPPPSWLSPDSESSTCSSEDDEEMDFSSHIGSLYSSASEAEESPVSSQRIEDTQDAQSLAPLRDQENEPQQEILDENNNNPVPMNSSSDEVPENDASLDIFEGLKVSSELIPVLHKIWAKHDNILEDHAICSKGLLTWALESLAKMVVILQSNTVTSLDESQAEYLCSTLFDLQSMHFRLDWLFPYVDRAMVLCSQKEKVKNTVELEATKSKLLTELQEVQGKLEDQKKLVSEGLPLPLVVEENLGEGIY